MISLAQFVAEKTAIKSALLYNPTPAREQYRGQCVQLIHFYLDQVAGTPHIWVETAFEWWSRRLHPEAYDYIENTTSAVPRPGDLIIWDKSLANSGGAGHIAICVTPRPGTGTFVSLDQNWGGKYPHLVTHNYTKVVGWLRPKNITISQPAQPVPTPQPTPQGGIEMIINETQARQAYGLLRPNAQPNQDEINATAGKRSWAQFASDAQTEVTQRDANLRNQASQLATMSETINAQNQAITDLTMKLKDSDATAQDKQAALQDAMTKLSQTNAELTTAHDEIKQLQDALNNPQTDATNQPVDVSWFVKLLAKILRK